MATAQLPLAIKRQIDKVMNNAVAQIKGIEHAMLDAITDILWSGASTAAKPASAKGPSRKAVTSGSGKTVKKAAASKPASAKRGRPKKGMSATAQTGGTQT